MHILFKNIPIGEPMLCEPAAAEAFILRCAALADPQANGLLQMLLGEQKPQVREVVGKVGVVPLKGIVGMGLDPINKALGMADLEDFTAEFRAMEADSSVKKILLDVNSPGGGVLGVEEAAAMVRESRKPVEAFGPMIGSAAYWIAGSARKVHGMASGRYGSIGAMAMVADTSAALERNGIKVHLIASGAFKGMFAPGTPVTEEHLAYATAQIGEIAGTFKKQVKSVRTSIPAEAMEGQDFRGRAAAANGIITSIVSSRADVLAKMNA